MLLVILTTCVFLGLPVSHGQYNYQEVLEKSIMFYEAQRSGQLPGNNRIPYRGDSAMGDGSDNGLDLTGGWYDAGDFVKFNFPMAGSTTLLAWGAIQWKGAYESSGQMGWMLECLRWPLDYFIKCHPSNDELYGQVGDGHVDHAFWGRPEDMTMFRPSFKLTPGQPGSDLAGETAAAMAAGFLVFQESDPGYAATLLSHARQIYEFAYNNRGLYQDSITNARDFYGSTGYNDELAHGAIWLYKATGESQYLDRAREFYSGGTAWALSWDSKDVAVQLLMYEQTGEAQYAQAVSQFLDSWFPGGGITYTPGGLAWRDMWGSNRYAANSAFVALMAADLGIQTGQSRAWARGQINYMLGDHGRSLVCGFGNNPPQYPHHGSSSCPPRPETCDWNDYNKPEPNPFVLYGALVGGPDEWDNYEDRRDDYISNEVACDYNAGFQSAIAGLIAANL